mmetsp:Transcript_41463/g.50255  ORF Transcript_41463/g.50255 Transcript_41463/m.50255 type:complete len:655 (-) Transcript_41463:272-2236(-)|eukprot:CAMPEP_0197857418 /NCGR_PEP_ID=MMETSP1438-20131217/30435_1 /TAXON_ID=1461541 /ORGANISM="Pterosperma sp., Strain CCMP1384" /LENGTH=654 /DNA_ID=CAMNT_0043473237 /DNA_START=147 /DNA_END=2111 /DNA_ORIENTATION=+
MASACSQTVTKLQGLQPSHVSGKKTQSVVRSLKKNPAPLTWRGADFCSSATKLHSHSSNRGSSTLGRKSQQLVQAVLMEPTLSEITNVDETKPSRTQIQVADIAPDTTTIRSLDWDRARFDIEFALEAGTTYNSYVIKGDKIALIDCSHQKMEKLYLDALAGVINPADIEVIVISHTEPDHSGLLGAVLELAPNATVYGSKVCINFLENMVHKPFKTEVVKNKMTVDLGAGHLLTFVLAPNLHWPDTIFTHDAATNYLYTCDAFGMHYCTEDIYDEVLKDIMGHYSFYYDCLMKPNARSVVTAMRKCKDLEIDAICTGHGPILKNHLAEMMGMYQKWSDAALEKSPESVAVLYESLYGYTEQLTKWLEAGLEKTEVAVELVDMSSIDTQDLIETIGRNSAIILLTPPAGGASSEMLGTLLAAVGKKQPVVIAESYGGNDEPVDTLMAAFQEQEVPMPIPPLKIRSDPTDQTFQLFEESATDLGQYLTKKTSLLKLKAMDPDVAKALGKVGGGLYVVTAAKGNARSAMIASWVSQASFEPIGFTVAVAKDRAIEALLHVGDPFVLNCLKEGNESGLMKHFLKRFPPGADRFEGVEWTRANNGAPIVSGTAAYIECTVKSRLETPDHWIVYSEVTHGAVADDKRTATHSRKVATYY